MRKGREGRIWVDGMLYISTTKQPLYHLSYHPLTYIKTVIQIIFRWCLNRYNSLILSQCYYKKFSSRCRYIFGEYLWSLGHQLWNWCWKSILLYSELVPSAWKLHSHFSYTHKPYPYPVPQTWTMLIALLHFMYTLFSYFYSTKNIQTFYYSTVIIFNFIWEFGDIYEWRNKS